MRAMPTALAALVLLPTLALADDDPFLWLEEVQGEKALAWVKEQNLKSTSELEAVPEFKPVYERTLEILDSKERIPTPRLLGATVYNFWKDQAHERGIWRRTSLASYREAQPQWETVLDVDALAKQDGMPWVYKGASCLPPAHRRCMIQLSRGGADASVYREFDTVTKEFVKDGFSLPEAKSNVAWRDEDTLWIGTDFGPGSLTTSGYPRIVKLWTRGTSLVEAKTVFEGRAGDVASSGYSQFTPEGRYDFVARTPAFYRQETFLVLGGRLVRLDLPEDAEINGVFKDRLLVSLRSDLKAGEATYRQGSLVAVALDDLLSGVRRFEVLFEPSERVSLDGVSTTRNHVLVSTLDNVRSKLAVMKLAGGAWTREEVALPGLGTAGVTEASDEDDIYFYTYQDFLTPSSLYLVDQGTAAKVKSLPAYFDPAGMKVLQYEATSKDGTKIPYFLVTPKGFVADGTAPTLLYGYGGFEISEVPTYSGSKGAAWLARGGVYALANIRGGGEFGPRWHDAALKDKRIKSFEDFIAIAEDLVARQVTSPRHLGIMGGSQGGLLVGGCLTMRPDLFGAVVSQVPLADMRRFSKLLAGASWMAEYGDPDVPEQWAYIRTWSPYHLLSKDAKYPRPFYWTNTRDDRVHPGHARKIVAKMQALGKPVLYFENTEGGHGSGAVNTQTAYVTALEYAYLWKTLR
jgi:prolyl oligopeptidase